MRFTEINLFGANKDIRVVGVAAEAETPAGQFFVEIIEHEIA